MMAAIVHDYPPEDPDQHEEDFDWAEYVEQRRRAQQARGSSEEPETLKTVLSGLTISHAIKQLAVHNLENAVHFITRRCCAATFLGINTSQHRCTGKHELKFVTSTELFTRELMLSSTDILTAFGQLEDADKTDLQEFESA
ncbi:hypothetical protein V8E36_006747 [Tilletia maclaganii]